MTVLYVGGFWCSPGLIAIYEIGPFLLFENGSFVAYANTMDDGPTVNFFYFEMGFSQLFCDPDCCPRDIQYIRTTSRSFDTPCV
jgi:hypothetical protein